MGFAGEYLYPRPTPAAAAAVDAFLPRGLVIYAFHAAASGSPGSSPLFFSGFCVVGASI